MTDTSTTHHGTFTVKDIFNNDIWLKEHTTGFTTAIDATPHKYNTELTTKLNSLSPGDQITATLKSQNYLRSHWKFTSIKKNKTH